MGGDGGETIPSTPPEASASVVQGIDVSFFEPNPGQIFQQQRPEPRHSSSADGGVDEGRDGRIIAVEDAEVSDLLSGYFEYCAEGFCHVTQVHLLLCF